MDFSNINFIAVLVAGVASWVIGAFWYSPLLFSKRWQKELGFSDEYLANANMPVIFGSSLVLMLIMALGLAGMIQDGNSDLMSGLKTGILTGLFFSATSVGINYLYQRKSIVLWLIDALYQIVFLGVSGAILGIWQ